MFKRLSQRLGRSKQKTKKLWEREFNIVKAGLDEKGRAMNPRRLVSATVAIVLTLSLLVPTSVLAGTPPTVTTDNATNITISSATISGNLTDLGTATTVNVFFEYGTTTLYGSTTISQAMTATGAFSANLTGLSPGTIYHFRATVIGTNGVAQGADVPFTTVAIPPVVSTTDNATNITINSAVVSGNLTDKGAATTIYVSFEYGTTASYGSMTTAQSMTGTGVFSASLTGLSSNTTYHFRAKAYGGAHGTANGADMTFATLTPVPPVVSTSPATSVTSNAATLIGNLTSLGTATTVDVSFEYGTTTSYGSTTIAQAMTAIGTFSATLTGLSFNTTYHFRAKADAGAPHGGNTGADMTFITMTPPTVTTYSATTDNATNITINSAVVSGNLTDLGTATTVNVFFEYGTTTSYGSTTIAQAMTTTGVFSANIIGLSSNITYHFRVNADGGVHGMSTSADKTFTTLILPLVVSTSPATGVTSNTTTLNGYLAGLGTATIVDVSFEYGPTPIYGSTTTAQAMTAAGVFSANLTGLSPGTLYHFRAKAVGDTIAIGTDITFTTTSIPPVVSTTGNATNITINSATVSGNLTFLGSATTANVSFEYGTTTSYGGTTIAQAMTATGVFSANLTSLSPGTLYHFRAKADGGAHGTATGADMTFTTLTPVPPVVSTSPATGVTSNAATLIGNLTLLGSATTANVSFEYGTTTSYGSTITAKAMTGTGAFSANLTGLSSNTTYHFRAKADGGAHGIATGADMFFTTLLTPVPPVVSTSPPTGVTNNTTTLNGYLGSLGSATTANVSFEYGTITSYGNTTTAQAMTAISVFSANLTGLSSNTTYHFRAKADGGVHGIATGADMFFTTWIPPTVTTNNATSITINSATVSGNLTFLGSATTANVSFEYGTTTSYGSNTTAEAKMSTGTFSANLTGLSPGTTYHFRAKADGGVHGIATGADMTFTTTPIPPTVTTNNATNITINSATVSGNLTSLGTATAVNVSFEYGTTTSYGSNTTAEAKMSTGTFSANIIGLSPGTLYHFRAKADGGAHGTATGADMTFTTTTAPTPLPPPSGGGGVSGGSLVPSGFTGTQPFVNFLGYVTQAGQLATPDDTLKLNIASGTRLLNSAGTRLTEFTVVPPSPVPPAPESNAIVAAYDLGPRGATFDPFISLTFNYSGVSLPTDVAESSLYIAWWDGTSWQILASTVDTAAKTVTANVSHFTEFALLGAITTRPPVIISPARFIVSDLSITSTNVTLGENVTITAVVTNSGGLTGTYSAVLMMNDVEAAKQEITLGARMSETVIFTITGDREGTYTISIDEQAGYFSVSVPSPLLPEPENVEEQAPQQITELPVGKPSGKGGLIGGIVGGFALIVGGLLYYLFVWRKRRTQKALQFPIRAEEEALEEKVEEPVQLQKEALEEKVEEPVQLQEEAIVAEPVGEATEELLEQHLPEERPSREEGEPASLEMDSQAPYVGEVDVEIATPVDPKMVYKLYDHLQTIPELKILHTRGSWDRGTVIAVVLDKPMPLVSLLSEMAGIEVTVEVPQKDSLVEGISSSLLGARRKGAKRIKLTLKEQAP